MDLSKQIKRLLEVMSPAEAQEFLEKQRQQYDTIKSRSESDFGNYQPKRDLTDAAGLLDLQMDGVQRGADVFVDTLDRSQPAAEQRTTRAIRQMQGAADARNQVLQPQGALRKDMLQMLIADNKDQRDSQKTGQLFDRLLRGAAIAGALLS